MAMQMIIFCNSYHNCVAPSGFTLGECFYCSLGREMKETEQQTNLQLVDVSLLQLMWLFDRAFSFSYAF